MSDSNKKDPLEEFFQKKSGDYDISYREEDWHSLENRLDALDAQLATRRRRLLAAAAVLIIFSILSYFIFQNYQQINSLNEQLSHQEEVTDPAPSSSRTPTDTTSPSLETLAQDYADNGEAPDPNSGDSAEEELASAQSESKSENTKSPTANDEIEYLSAQSKEETSNDFRKLATADIAISEIQCPGCTLSELALNGTVNESAFAAGRISTDYPQIAQIALAGDVNTGSEVSALIASQQNLPKFSIGVVTGPDLSSAGSFSNFYDAGSKIGITVDYNLNRNWAISIGAVRSNVHYKADMQDYRPPEGYWYNGIEASLTRAECSLIDIPVSLSYRFLHFDNSRIYATAGVSSYIMLSEDYRFSYQSGQQGLPQRWKEDTGSTHFLSNAGFSVGYELDVTQNVSVRAEPFMKVPLREVGWGNVDLYSIGSLFSLNYKL